jgi:hypothetical protein
MSEAPWDRSSAPIPGGRVMAVGPEGQPIGGVRVAGPEEPAGSEDATPREDLSAAVEEPAKVMRIGMMIKQLLEEVRGTDLDDASRGRLREIHASSLRELETALAPELRDELTRLVEPFTADEPPSTAELRITKAQLIGWLEGLFQGIQTALVAQQMAARGQLEQMRRGLPPGSSGTPGSYGTTGQYL